MKMNIAEWIAFILLVIGGLNWGLVGLFEYDLVAELFGGQDATVAKVIYVLVGLGALYLLVMAPMKGKKDMMPKAPMQPQQ